MLLPGTVNADWAFSADMVGWSASRDENMEAHSLGLKSWDVLVVAALHADRHHLQLETHSLLVGQLNSVMLLAENQVLFLLLD